MREPTCFLCISETFCCGSSSSSSRKPSVVDKKDRQTVIEVRSRALACLFEFCLVFMLTSLCSRNHIATQRIRLSKTFLSIVATKIYRAMTLEIRCCMLLPQECSDKRVRFQKSAESRESICERSVPGLLNNLGLIGSAMSELTALCS